MHFVSSVINFTVVFLILALALTFGTCFSFAEDAYGLHPNHIDYNSGKSVAQSNVSDGQPKTGIFKPIRAVVTTIPNPNSTTTPAQDLTPEDQVAVLIHNSYRITHVVPGLTFSPELKTLAMMCAEFHVNNDDLTACPLIASGSSSAAESLYSHPIATIPSPSQLIRTALEDWYNIENSLPGPCPNFADLKYDAACVEKVQMIWKSTTQFACATSKRSSPGNMLYTSCVYSPPGNVKSLPQFAANVFPPLV